LSATACSFLFPGLYPGSALLQLEQLDLEGQGRVRRDDATGAPTTMAISMAGSPLRASIVIDPLMSVALDHKLEVALDQKLRTF
jgi:hypothetical protein